MIHWAEISWENAKNFARRGWIILSFEFWTVRKNFVGGILLLYTLVCVVYGAQGGIGFLRPLLADNRNSRSDGGGGPRIMSAAPLAAKQWDEKIAPRGAWWLSLCARWRAVNNGWSGESTPVTCNISLFSEIKSQNMRQVRGVARRANQIAEPNDVRPSVRYTYTWHANYFALIKCCCWHDARPEWRSANCLITCCSRADGRSWAKTGHAEDLLGR